MHPNLLSLPYLGLHVTHMVRGHLAGGPNALLLLVREGYRWRHVSLSGLWQLTSFGGLCKKLEKCVTSGLPAPDRSSLPHGVDKHE
jgi:hypothetical protein